MNKPSLSNTMYTVLLPLCTFPLIGMIVSDLLDLPINTWYLFGLFGMNMMKSIVGGLGLCFKDVLPAKQYFAVFYLMFLITDVVAVSFFLSHEVYDSALFILCFVVISIIGYVPIINFLLNQRWQRSWASYFRFQHAKGQPVGRSFIVLSSVWLTAMVLLLGYLFQTMAICFDETLSSLWFIGVMVTWMALFITSFLGVAACVPFRRKPSGTLYSPIINDVVEINRQDIRNKNILYSLFGTAFLLSACMLGYQVVALQLPNTTNMDVNQTCIVQQLTNTTNTTYLPPLVISAPMLALDIMIMVVPCLVFAVFNFLRICLA